MMVIRQSDPDIPISVTTDGDKSKVFSPTGQGCSKSFHGQDRVQSTRSISTCSQKHLFDKRKGSDA